MKGFGATVRAVGIGATLEPTVVPPVPVVVKKLVAEEALEPTYAASYEKDALPNY